LSRHSDQYSNSLLRFKEEEMLHWRMQSVFLVVMVAMAISAFGGGIHWACALVNW